MNINKLFDKAAKDNSYVSSIRRSTATMIDMSLVLFLRMIVMQLLAALWLDRIVLRFLEEFHSEFGTELIKNNPEHINFIIQHKVFYSAIIFYLTIIMVGAIYHAYFNASRWRGTLGKRIMNIMIQKEDGSRLSFKTGFAHYFLSILPFIYLFYLLSFQIRNNLNFYQAVTYSQLNIFFGVIFIIWVQIHAFSKRKTTAYDLICKTIFIKGRTDAKLPWCEKNKK